MYLLIVCFIILAYWYGIRNYDYWKKKGVIHDKPLPYFGTNLKQYLQKATWTMIAAETYRKYPNEKIVGFYRGVRPELIIRDPEIIKRILTTDFQYFYPRGLLPPTKYVEPMLKNLFFADGDTWKLLRQRITPAFSTGKLKAMFSLITERAEKLQGIAESYAVSDSVVDVRDLMACYTTDFIGACGFGLNVDALSDTNSEFRRLGKRIFQRTVRDALAAISKQIFPSVFEKVHYLDSQIEKSMVHIVNKVCEERNYKPAGRNDFIDLMLELKQSGDLVGESIENKNADGTPVITTIVFDDLLLTAQVFVFFGAGFEASSSASSFTLHQLAFHPECQKKVQKEIDEILTKYNNKITYDAIKEMVYLEMAFSESMRMYPSVGFLMRSCAIPEYTIPEVDVTINKGVNVLIPIQALHNDEQYFKEPEKFKPERFSYENKQTIQNYTYMPFGDGPRACVGARLGQMQSLAGIVALLQKYTVEPAANSLQYPIPDPAASIAENFVGGLPLKLKRRST